MNLPKLLPVASILGAVCLSFGNASDANAQTSAATDPVGFTTANLLANSDSLISIPFTRPAVFTGTIASISGSTITVSASPGWTTNQFTYASGTQSNTYYAIIGPNPAAVTGTVSATNGSTSITGSGSAFSQMVAGDEILINGTAATVASVVSATSLTLVSPFIGTTVTGATATFDHSPKEGAYYTVTANGTNSLTVNLNGDSLSSIASSLGSTSVSLIPYWTLGTAFPSSDAYDPTNNPNGSYVASTGTTSRTRGTSIFLPDLTSAGINLGVSATYIYFQPSGGTAAWRALTVNGVDTSNSYNDVILPPTSYFTVRNNATATTFTPTGGVYMNRISVALDTQASSGQDNAVALPRPVAVALNDTNLVSSGAFVASTGTTSRTRGDTLFVYDNTQTGVNKAPSATYIYLQPSGGSGAWRTLTVNGVDTTTDYGTVTIPYGTGFLIRKNPTASGSTAFWQNTRNY